LTLLSSALFFSTRYQFCNLPRHLTKPFTTDIGFILMHIEKQRQ
jgi:hypothetical protein